jgi:hypothetical protein
MGHLAQQRQNVRSTKPKPPPTVPLLPSVSPPEAITPSKLVIVTVVPLSRLYTNDTGHFLIRAQSGNQYVMIAYHADGNLILQQAFQTKSDCHRITAYNAIMTQLAARGLSVDLQILDNEASSAYKQAITFTWKAQFQLVPPDMHCRNRAERAIRTFKDHFIAILAGVDPKFPPYLWELLLPQAELTLNLLGNQQSILGSPLGNTSKVHSTSTRLLLAQLVVVCLSMPNQAPVAHGTSAPRKAFTLGPPWNPTDVSNSSSLTPKAKSSPTWLNSGTPTSLFLCSHRKTKSSMDCRLLQALYPVHLHLQVSPNSTTCANPNCTSNPISCTCPAPCSLHRNSALPGTRPTSHPHS